MLETSKSIRWSLEFCGYELKNATIVAKVKCKFLLLLIMYTIIQSCFVVAFNWGSINKIFLALEDANILCFSLIILLDYTFLPDDIITLLEILDSGYYNVNEHADKYISTYKEKLLVVNCSKIKEKGVIKKLTIVLTCSVTSQILQPISVIIYLHITNSPSIEDYPFLVEFHNFFSNKMNFELYIVVFALGIYLLVHLCVVIFNVYASTMAAARNIVIECKLLILSVKDVDDWYEEILNNNCIVNEREVFDRNLKIATRNIVRHHQIICRKLAMLNKGASVNASIVYTVGCFQMCMSLLIFQEKDVAMELRQMVSCLVALFFVYIMGDYGQSITDGGKELAEALSLSSWYNKPQWYKTTIVIMLTQANRIPEFKPFGLFPVNYESVKKLIQASYSYFNFLRTSYS